MFLPPRSCRRRSRAVCVRATSLDLRVCVATAPTRRIIVAGLCAAGLFAPLAIRHPHFVSTHSPEPAGEAHLHRLLHGGRKGDCVLAVHVARCFSRCRLSCLCWWR